MREAFKDNSWGLHEASGFGVLIVMAAINLGLYRYKQSKLCLDYLVNVEVHSYSYDSKCPPVRLPVRLSATFRGKQDFLCYYLGL